MNEQQSDMVKLRWNVLGRIGYSINVPPEIPSPRIYKVIVNGNEEDRLTHEECGNRGYHSDMYKEDQVDLETGLLKAEMQADIDADLACIEAKLPIVRKLK